MNLRPIFDGLKKAAHKTLQYEKNSIKKTANSTLKIGKDTVKAGYHAIRTGIDLLLVGPKFAKNTIEALNNRRQKK